MWLLMGLVSFWVGTIRTETCPPLYPSKNKVRALQRYRNGLAPVVFLHIQKAGGTSVCEMWAQEMSLRNGTSVDRGDNCNGDWQGLLRKPDRLPSSPQLLVSMEPAYNFMGSFPEEYYSHTHSVLSSSGKHAFWRSVPAITAVRHPLESALSAFTYDFAYYRQSIWGSCRKRNIDINTCMQYAIEVREGKNLHGDIWGGYQRNKIVTHILGNFMTMHLSSSGLLEEAKDNLARFSLVMDLKDPTTALRLLHCVLGWTHVPAVTHANEGRTKTRQKRRSRLNISAALSPPLLTRMRSYMHDDVELYAYAKQLIQGHMQALESHASKLSH